MVGVLRYQHMGQQTRARQAAFEGPAGRWHLHDAGAAGASQPRTHVPNDVESRRHVFQLFRHVLAQLLELAIAVRAGIQRPDAAHALRVADVEEMACARPSCVAPSPRGLCFGHRLLGFRIFELELQLFDLLVQLLGAPAKLHAPQLGQHEFQGLHLGGGDS